MTVVLSDDRPGTALVPLTDAATITIDGSQWDDFAILSVTLGGSRTFAAPINMHDGQRFILIIRQGTGSNVPTFNAAFSWSTDQAAPTWSTAASKVDVAFGMYDSALNKVLMLSKNFGFN